MTDQDKDIRALAEKILVAMASSERIYMDNSNEVLVKDSFSLAKTFCAMAPGMVEEAPEPKEAKP